MRRPPGRFEGMSALTFTLLLAVAALILASLGDVAPSPQRLYEGGPRIAKLVGRMMPPETDPAFLVRMGWRMLETLQIALVGTAFGVLISVPIAWAAARGVTPFGAGAVLFRGLVSFARTVPDLVWALIFVSAVGLGAVPARSRSSWTRSAFAGGSLPRPWKTPNPSRRRRWRPLAPRALAS
ncbi:MAG: hypothetical protein AAGC57_04715 [Pseudomonadota bacterium]